MTKRTDSFLEMITYRRPAGSETEELFIERFIDSLGATKDEYGNRMLRIGTAPVMWSCHTDTVHRLEGTQAIVVKEGVVSIAPSSSANSNCLGADCTTGVWIMTEMIKAGVEGLYIFHREEECGAGGSKFIVNKTPEVVKGINFAIAFDRYGTTSIITNQCGRCCSNDFADSMIEQMPNFRRDSNGIFTDTAFYTGIIPECTNVSVGYMGHHSSSETQNLMFMDHVLDLMIGLDISKLRVSRDMTAKAVSEKVNWQSWYEEENYDMGGWSPPRSDPKEDSMLKLVKANPETAAGLLNLYGISAQEFIEHAFSSNSIYAMQ